MPISIKVTRIVMDGHLVYELEGNFAPRPCGIMVEQKIMDLFSKNTGVRKATESHFFRILDRDTDTPRHNSLYVKHYCDKLGNPRPRVPARDIKFIDLRPVDVLFHNLHEANKGGAAAMRKEFGDILKILAGVEDKTDCLIVEMPETVKEIRDKGGK